ncbi:unnamed protein product [Ilex paraguariensis]|uniref:Uncharacterized protein n=1 Tax=Ilex paraguariensis TaxID=185542 RepID=A0ABC8U5V6_9AQUA
MIDDASVKLWYWRVAFRLGSVKKIQKIVRERERERERGYVGVRLRVTPKPPQAYQLLVSKITHSLSFLLQWIHQRKHSPQFRGFLIDRCLEEKWFVLIGLVVKYLPVQLRNID